MRFEQWRKTFLKLVNEKHSPRAWYFYNVTYNNDVTAMWCHYLSRITLQKDQARWSVWSISIFFIIVQISTAFGRHFLKLFAYPRPNSVAARVSQIRRFRPKNRSFLFSNHLSFFAPEIFLPTIPIFDVPERLYYLWNFLHTLVQNIYTTNLYALYTLSGYCQGIVIIPHSYIIHKHLALRIYFI